jgi:SpoVK/Ycf46/Vps4 family AAA+-type ATPase
MDLAHLLGLTEEEFTDENDTFSPKAALAALKKMHARIETDAGALRATGPVAVNARNLAGLIGLTEVETQILEFAVLVQAISELNTATDLLGDLTATQTRRVLATILGCSEAAICKALAQDGALAQSGLVGTTSMFSSTLSVNLGILSDSFRDRMTLEGQDALDLVKDTILAAGPRELAMGDFAHLGRPLEFLVRYLRAGLERGQSGINVFIHGASGTGKTQLVRVLAHALGAALYEIALGDDDSDSPVAVQRLRSYRAAQRLFADRDSLLLFDEAEDVFNDGSRFVGPKSTAQRRKAWINRALEENRIPTFWLSNDVDCMDPAFLRRFDMILEMNVPPTLQRRRIAERIAARSLTETSLNRLMGSDALAPAVLARAVRVAGVARGESTPADYSADVEMLVDNTLRAQGHAGLVASAATELPAWYDAGFLNTDADMTALAEGLAGCRAGRLCLFGPPGTGKSAFGRWLADTLDLPLLVRRASDLVSPFVGETEQNLARMFRTADAERSVLLLDEVDSFLQDRRNAVRSWEVSAVNELLTQMETFSGVFVASTNLMDSIDPAALRRFDVKVRFDYLRPEQAWDLLGRLCQGLGLAAPEPGLIARLGHLSVLTPGDFAVVARQHRFRRFSDAAQVLEALKAECVVKEDGKRQRMGFV